MAQGVEGGRLSHFPFGFGIGLCARQVFETPYTTRNLKSLSLTSL